MPAVTLPLDPRTARLLAQELKPGETVLWQSGAFIRRHLLLTLPVFLFALPWTAFAVFWMAMASRASLVFGCFGLPFVGVGLAMLSSPWWMARRVRRIGYVLTTDRVLILTPSMFGDGIEVRSFAPGDLGRLERVQREDGSGDLIFSGSGCGAAGAGLMSGGSA